MEGVRPISPVPQKGAIRRSHQGETVRNAKTPRQRKSVTILDPMRKSL